MTAGKGRLYARIHSTDRGGKSDLGLIRLGVFGGTFNPIHFGHLHIAQNIQRIFSLSQIYFVVAAIPPHKPLEDLVSLTHRYAMVSLATAGSPSFIPSLVELEPPASSFSIDTMNKLAHQFSGRTPLLYFIAGGDSMLEVKTWQKSEKLLTSYNFVFVVRPGMGAIDSNRVLPVKSVSRLQNLVGLGKAQLRRLIRAEEKKGESRIYLLDIAAPDISATQIRRLASAGKSIRNMVPALVREYINKFHLYGER